MTADASLRNVPLRELQLAIVDVESTGIEATRDRILEVAIVHVQFGQPPALVLDTLVDPERPVAWTEVHGITEWHVDDAPTFDDLVSNVVHSLAGRVVVAHNAEFDLPIIGASLTRAGVMLAVPPHLCTLRLARVFCSSVTSRALGPLCDALSIEHRDRHVARGDAFATAELVCRFIAAMESAGLASMADLDRYAVAHRLQFPFLRSFEVSPWESVPLREPSRMKRARKGVAANAVGHAALRRYRDEVLGAVRDLEVTDAELVSIRTLRDELGLSDAQVRAMHARVFHEHLSRSLDDDLVNEGEAEALADLARCLRILGWAPGT